MWINQNLFIENEIPRLHPLTEEYRSYWRTQKKFCIEGRWIGGRFMPGPLYFYINFGTILYNKKKNSKYKVPGRPSLWDIHWESAYLWSEARGISGFEKQVEGANIRDLLRNTTVDLGKPLYENEAKNLVILSSRDSGKSYFVADALIAHEFLFNGCKEYNEEEIKNPPSTDILVGAGDAKYSGELLKKVKLCIDSLPGGMEINGKYYPPPFYKQTTGSYMPGKDLIQSYQKKVGGSWMEVGSKSSIKHRTFGDNPFAAAGMRLSTCVIEEAGFCDNLIALHEATADTMMNSGVKFGSACYLGTGGDMSSKTLDAHKIFYDPETYDMISIEDIWEGKGLIGYFIPDYLANRDFKDINGISNEPAAKQFELDKREKIRKGKNASNALDAHIQYHPIVPSEMFLSKSGNIFPKAELQAHLSHLESNPIYKNAEYIGDLVHNEAGKIEWRLNPNLQPIVDFPLDHKKDNIEGCIVIWEHPYTDSNGDVPYGLYVAGTDPYDHDEAGVPSLGSTFIYKRYFSNDQTYETIVAEYSGRPKADEYYKRLINLLLYYNAVCLYENEKKGLHQYAAQKNYDYLLMDQPQYIKDVVPNSSVNRNKGMHMSIPLKVHGETLIKNWLETEYVPTKMQLTKIRSIPLLKELIAYNRTQGNYDRVMALMQTVYAIQERIKLTIDEPGKIIEVHQQDFFNKPLYTKSNNMTTWF